MSVETNETMIKMTAAEAPHKPMLKTQPSLFPAIEETINPAMHSGKTTAHAMRMARMAGLLVISEPKVCI